MLKAGTVPQHFCGNTSRKGTVKMDTNHKELDNLSKDMIQCKKDGYGVHYGNWKAAQNPVEYKKPPLPSDWRVCPWCNTPFKLKNNRKRIYCDVYCQRAAQEARERQKKKECGANQ